MLHGTRPQNALTILALDVLLGSRSKRGGAPSAGRDNLPYMADDFKILSSYNGTPDDAGATFWSYTYAYEIRSQQDNKQSVGKLDPVSKRGQRLYGADGCIITILWVRACHFVDYGDGEMFISNHQSHFSAEAGFEIKGHATTYDELETSPLQEISGRPDDWRPVASSGRYPSSEDVIPNR